MINDRYADMAPEAAEKRKKICELINECGKVIVGKKDETVLLVSALLAGGHILIEDVPGTGKTTLAATVAKCAGLKFRRAQFTPDVMASDITGFNIYNRAKESFEFREGIVNCNILLADEINRASPKTQSALLEAMEEGRVTVDGKTYSLPSPFCVIATQNPAGYVGTYPLPEAQMDRFMIRINMGYPTEDEELSVILARKEENPLDLVSRVVSLEELREASLAAEKTELAPEIARYIVSLTGATRKSPLITLGASPRASIALMRMSKAFAFISGRDYVIPEDVRAVFYPVTAHRISVSQDARLEGLDLREVLRRVSSEVSVPLRRDRRNSL